MYSESNKTMSLKRLAMEIYGLHPMNVSCAPATALAFMGDLARYPELVKVWTHCADSAEIEFPYKTYLQMPKTWGYGSLTLLLDTGGASIHKFASWKEKENQIKALPFPYRLITGYEMLKIWQQFDDDDFYSFRTTDLFLRNAWKRKLESQGRRSIEQHL